MPPILVKYKKELDSRFDSIDSEKLLQFFKQTFRKQGVNYFELKRNSTLEFKIEGSWLMSNWNIWSGIKRGTVEIRQSGNQRMLNCEIDMTGNVLVASGIVVAFQIISFLVYNRFYWPSLLVVIPFVFALIIMRVRHEDNVTGTLNELLKFQEINTKTN